MKFYLCNVWDKSAVLVGAYTKDHAISILLDYERGVTDEEPDVELFTVNTFEVHPHGLSYINDLEPCFGIFPNVLHTQLVGGAGSYEQAVIDTSFNMYFDGDVHMCKKQLHGVYRDVCFIRGC